MYRFILFEMIEEEFKKNDKLSEEFLQKIRDIGTITEYAPQLMIGGVLELTSDDRPNDCPKITEDFRKIKTTADLYHTMERLKSFEDKHLPQDIGKCPVIMHAFIPKNRN